MKKTWVDPTMESLDISQTAGGTQLNHIQDGPEWQDEDGKWYIPVGEDEDIS